ncbi:MAG: hypothetical protein D6677_01505 [Calditrichaeota bacterium]|nr:MAG: hypothetical protein D6677_01505 [Calditrichota bacterium]
MAHTVQTARAILREARGMLMEKSNVVATGIGYKIVNGRMTDQLCVVCSVDRKQAVQNIALKNRIPMELDGLPTDVFTTGPLTVFQDHKSRQRPAPGGVSIGHYAITAGTFGCVVMRDGRRHILSNNHVLANSNDAQIGDDILQPGPTDGGYRPDDVIARLADFIPIHYDGSDMGGDDGGDSGCVVANTAAGALNALSAMAGRSSRLKAVYEKQAAENLVDAAIALPVNDGDIKEEILEIGQISGVAEGALNMQVKKSGRTTGLTNGQIIQVDVTSRVNYGSGRTATFTDQLMAGNMSAGGDSGSAILNEDNAIVGLLFAGSSNSTIINRIQNVFELLNIGLP